MHRCSCSRTVRGCISVGCVCPGGHWCVWVCESHNSTTVGQRVQPYCSLSGRRVSWYKNLIHFALALTLNSLSHSRSLSNEQTSSYIAVAHAVASMFCVTTQTELILEMTVLATSFTPAPVAPTDRRAAGLDIM